MFFWNLYTFSLKDIFEIKLFHSTNFENSWLKLGCFAKSQLRPATDEIPTADRSCVEDGVS